MNCLWLLLFFLSVAQTSIVSTSIGKLEGAEFGDFEVFKRIPFAKPPIGKLRFQKPENPLKWEGIRNAKVYGPACMSNSSTTSSPQKWVDEDCLHINIFTTKNCLKTKECATVVYIHGGELVYDSAVMFNDSFLFDTFSKRDVILVIPAFRIGIFSHFVIEDQEVAPNNLALYDILHSMEFVKREIHNFGGDNKKITLFGHSYGASIASVLSFSTEVNQDLSLFQQTVSMSSVIYFDTLNFQIEKTMRFAEHANCNVPSNLLRKFNKKQRDTYMMECLQKLDAFELLRVQRKLEDLGFPLYDSLVHRGPILQEVPIPEFYNSPKNIPTLTGCTKYELDKYQQLMDIVKWLGFENYEECNEKYRKDKKEGNYDFEGHADETQVILAQTKQKADKLIEKGITTYLYEYTYPKHAVHTDDLSYLFGIHTFEKDENEQKLGTVYQNIFMNFVKYGDPKMGFEKSNLENSQYFNVFWNETSGERPKMKSRFEEKLMNYWLKEMVEFDRNITAYKTSHHLKTPSLKFYSETSSEYYQLPYMYISLLMISLIFITGCLVGKLCFAETRERNLYIQLDGDDQEWRLVKDY